MNGAVSENAMQRVLVVVHGNEKELLSDDCGQSIKALAVGKKTGQIDFDTFPTLKRLSRASR